MYLCDSDSLIGVCMFKEKNVKDLRKLLLHLQYVKILLGKKRQIDICLTESKAFQVVYVIGH